MMRIFLIILIFVSCGTESSSDKKDGILDGEHRIFVSSQTYTGNIGGLEGADEKCTELARAAKLKRNYRAILSTSSEEAKTRLNLQGTVYLFGSSGVLTVVELGTNLWSGELLHEINFNENQESITANVWTGTDSDGGTFFDDHCQDWTSDSGSETGSFGESTSLTDNALESDVSECDQNLAIYCISE